MALPRKLKNMNLFNEGATYMGVAKSVTLPKLTRKMESWRGAGMNGPVKVDHGLGDDGLQLEWTLAGWDLPGYASWHRRTDGVASLLRVPLSATIPARSWP